MRKIIKRAILLVVLVLILYLGYVSVNPNGAENIKNFFMNINLPFGQNAERTITVKEAVEKEADKVEKQKEKEQKKASKTGNEAVLKGTVVITGDEDNDIEENTQEVQEKRAEGENLPDQDTPPKTADTETQVEAEGQLSEEEKKQIEDLIYSLIKE